MKSYHAPGPWISTVGDGKRIIRAGHKSVGKPIASCYGRGKETDANAALIAASPDLLRVCKRLLKLHYDTGNASLEGLEATKEAEAIIAKATQAKMP